MSNFENKIIIIIIKKRQSKSSNTINLYIYLSVLKLLSKIDVYMYILYKQEILLFVRSYHCLFHSISIINIVCIIFIFYSLLRR